MLLKLVTSLLVLSGAALGASADYDNEKHTLGWLEHVRIADLDIELDAKLDTGATTSSIHAEIMSAPPRKKFDDEDESRDIIFKVINEDGDERTIETKISRWAAIKTKQGGVLYRPVVKLEFCLGGLLIEDEVTLADRGNFNYETLIGRNMLETANIVVDSGEIYTKRARCPK
jgi:hypothetical protein